MCVYACMNVLVSRSLEFTSAQTLLQNLFEASCESTVETTVYDRCVSLIRK